LTKDVKCKALDTEKPMTDNQLHRPIFLAKSEPKSTAEYIANKQNWLILSVMCRTKIG